MLDEPEILHLEEQAAAVIHLTIARHEIQHMMGPAIREVLTAVSTQGIGPTGPVFSHHLRLSPDTWDFEVGVPVSEPVTETGRVKSGTLPGGRVARAIYHGGYEGLGEGWSEFMAWLEGQELPIAAHFWERYLVGPESGPDPALWQTELNRPLAG